jgi:hypothetical protein
VTFSSCVVPECFLEALRTISRLRFWFCQSICLQIVCIVPFSVITPGASDCVVHKQRGSSEVSLLFYL